MFRFFQGNVEDDSGYAYLSIVGIFALTRLYLFTLGYLVYSKSFTFLQHTPWIHTSSKLFDLWAIWDSSYYIDIALNGYSSEITYAGPLYFANYAFFPLYPILMRLLNLVTSDAVISGVLISNISLLCASFVFYWLLRLDYSSRFSLNALSFMYIFPTSFIFSAVYTESLFLLLTVLAFYYVRTGRIFRAGVFGFLGSLTRSLGVFIVIPFAFEYLARSMRVKVGNVLCLALPVFGLMLFAFFSYKLTGDPFAFVSIQKGWKRELTLPTYQIVSGILSVYPAFKLVSLFAIFALFYLILSTNKYRYSYFLYSLYAILVPMLTSIISVSRYLIVVFPMYIWFALFDKKHPVAGVVLKTLLLVFQCVLFVLWITGFNLLI